MLFQMLFPLPGGEGEGEGEPKTLFSVAFFHKGSPSPRPSPPRRGRIIVRSFCESDTFVKARPTVGDGEERRQNYQTNVQMLFPLPGGEGKGEGEPKTLFSVAFFHKGSPSPRPSPPRRGRILVRLFCEIRHVRESKTNHRRRRERLSELSNKCPNAVPSPWGRG